MTNYLANRITPAEQERLVLEGELKEKTWRFIGSHVEDTVAVLQKVVPLIKIKPGEYQNYESLHFCDVGCGTGNILLMFYCLMKANRPEMGVFLNGIEHNPILAKSAQEAVRGVGLIHNQDAFDYDYSKEDIIYYYQPIRDKELMKKLEQKIEEEAHVGSFIISQLKVDRRIEKDNRFKMLLDTEDWFSPFRVYKKIKK